MRGKGDARWVANDVSGMSCAFGEKAWIINRQGNALKHKVFEVILKCVVLVAIAGLQSARGVSNT